MGNGILEIVTLLIKADPILAVVRARPRIALEGPVERLLNVWKSIVAGVLVGKRAPTRFLSSACTFFVDGCLNRKTKWVFRLQRWIIVRNIGREVTGNLS